MKGILPFLLCFNSLVCCGQITTATQWTWVLGDNTINTQGVYGIQGVYDVSNKPGAREDAVSWTDISGNFWLFGGNGYGTSTRGLLNDLWKYDVSINMWVWMKGSNDISDAGEYGAIGIPDPANSPGARHGAISWIDAMGNLWLFGGEGFTSGNPTGFLNDLWKYDPSINEWAWVSGDPAPDQSSEFGVQGVSDPGNKPGSRSGSVSWIDGAGMLWLFGGLSYNFPVPGYSNDLWRYDPITGEWTWMKGNTTLNEPGIYGTVTVPNSGNTPGGRRNAGKWMDMSGNIWLFGGEGLDESSASGTLNDLWKYNMVSNAWTWMKGNKVVNQSGIYGIAGISAPANFPGARKRTYTWKDPSGLLWLYGGEGYGSSAQGLLNDLWKYNVTTGQWTWMKGDGNININTVFGIQGTGTATTRPGSRSGGVTFTEPAGNLWLFGGNGYDGAGTTDLLNDLWRLGSFTIVPVNGLNLFASRVQNNVFLRWQTEQEFNTDHFEIEKSDNGINYSVIGTKAAAGSSPSLRRYDFVDNDPLGRRKFYRIKLFDSNGFLYSNVVVIKMTVESLEIFPNPVMDVLYVRAAAINNNTVIRVIDSYGRKLKEQRTSFNENTLTLDVSALPFGMYVLEIQNGQDIQRRQFIKQ